MLALDEQGAFLEEVIQKVALEAEPSDWAIRMARNWSYYEAYAPLISLRLKLKEAERGYVDVLVSSSDPLIKEELNQNVKALREQLDALKVNLKWSNDVDFRDALNKPVSDEDRNMHMQQARVFAAKMRVTRTVMAQELGVDENNLVIVLQKKYHIDKEMYVAPNGIVYVQDEGLVQNALVGLRCLGKMKKSVEAYFAASRQREAHDQFVNKANDELLNAMGCKVVPVAAYYEAEGEKPINFCNGLTYGDLFITNQAIEHFDFLETTFSEVVSQNSPSLKVIFTGGRPIQDILQAGAGMRCITRVIPRLLSS